MPDYMPRKDGDFLSWAKNFSTYLEGHAAEMGITPDEAAAIKSGVDTMDESFAGYFAAQRQALSLNKVKTDARQTTQDSIRTLVRQLQASPLVSDEQRASLGITIEGCGAAAMTTSRPTRPIASVDTSQRLRHTIYYRDEATPTRRARPAHCRGCEIWCKIAASSELASLNPDTYQNLGLNTASPFIKTLSAADAGKTAYYMLRWVRSNGDKGPWSEIISATVVG